MDAQMTSAVAALGCTAIQPDAGWGCGVELRPVPALDKKVKFQQGSVRTPSPDAASLTSVAFSAGSSMSTLMNEPPVSPQLFKAHITI